MAIQPDSIVTGTGLNAVAQHVVAILAAVQPTPQLWLLGATQSVQLARLSIRCNGVRRANLLALRVQPCLLNSRLEDVIGEPTPVLFTHVVDVVVLLLPPLTT